MTGTNITDAITDAMSEDMSEDMMEDAVWGDLIAIRVLLPSGPSIDPWSLADGTGRLIAAPERVVVGIGTAHLFDLPNGLTDVGGLDALVDKLATLPCSDHLRPDAGCGHPVIAFGALPFNRTAPSALAVCSQTYGREADGTEWVTVVGGRDEATTATSDPDRLRATLASHAATRRPPSVFADASGSPEGTRALSDDDFRSAVAMAVDAIEDGSITKVVVARHVDVFPSAPLDEAALLTRWRDMEPGCTLVALPTPEGRFLGASPELLVSRQGLDVASTPLAGTTDRHHDASSVLPSTLLGSAPAAPAPATKARSRWNMNSARKGVKGAMTRASVSSTPCSAESAARASASPSPPLRRRRLSRTYQFVRSLMNCTSRGTTV
jgi:hypothetical protein